MLSIGAASGGQGEYYVNLARPDYYVAGGEPPGRWLGGAARDLRLEGQAVERGAFLSYYSGKSPDGTVGVMNAGQPDRVPGHDLTFSAPKSVSLMWATGDLRVRYEIETAQRASVDATLAYLQENYAYTRRGKNGSVEERAKILTAVFDHGTSRALDAQLHSHAFVINWGQRADGTVGTLVSRPLYEQKMELGALYRAELAAQLEARLGLRVVRERSWFEGDGVPRGLMAECSTRSREIREVLAERGHTSAAAAAAAAQETKTAKVTVPRADLFPAWQEVAARHGLTPEAVRGLCGPAPERDRAALGEAAVRDAVSGITEQHSHFTRGELVRRTAEAAQGHGLGLADVVANVDRHLAECPEVVRLGAWKGQERFTTREMLALEASLMSRVERAKLDTSHRVRAETVAAAIDRRPTITDEQAAALAHITQRPGAVQAVSGLAGTGKTFLLDAAREVWEADGYRVVGAALAGKAARGLEEGSDIVSDTLHRRLLEIEQGRVPVDERTVVVVDEFGMVGTRMGERLTRAVTDRGGKLVLVGDARQLQPVEAGGPFQAISQAVGAAELNQITRQREGWHREAVERFSAGNAGEALRAFSERGLVHVAEDRVGAMRELIARWKERALAAPGECLIFAGEGREAAALNRLAQAERAGAGLLGAERVTAGGEAFHAGDRVLFTRNTRVFGLRNGDLGTVVEAREGRGELAVRLDGGRVVVVPLADYDHVKLGYAMTTHKGQGVTCEAAFVLAGGGMQDRHLTYVQASRARGETRLFIDEQEAGAELTLIARRMEQERFKGMASELLRQNLLVQQQQREHQQVHNR
jgi:conjugative relaxase-like TrwC/TraI family protein